MASKFDNADRLTDDERTVFMLRAFRHCHDVDWLVCKRLPTFAIHPYTNAVQADGANSGAVYTLHKCKGDKGVQTEVVTVTHDVQ